MRPAVLTAVILSVPLLSPVSAGASETGRYTMLPAPSGVVRLDTQTGALALCTLSADAPPQCRPATDDEADLQREVARLKAENADLKAKLAAKGPSSEAAPAAPAPAGPGIPKAESEDQQFEKALGFADRFMRHMMQILREEHSDERT